ncbi:MAG: ATP-binding protein [Candidatus Omnitrophica bacterium]|nr:ATP-binding protein [Candidatus Omnitrophota bacterium]MDE2010216.1 ATP-binding protein [Candidatus Omnitrophota bacterium]MDE2231710.1 ATP-binding protein [Candidatus Omnitrophota bacterium]
MNLIDFDHNFFGRRGVLEVLKKRVMGLKEGYRQNVALLGNRYVGKTALLQRLMSQMEELEVFFLYLDLEARDFDYFAVQFTKSLLYNFLKQENLPLQEDLKLLCAEAKDLLPRTVFLVQAIEELTAQGKVVEAYHMILSLPEVFTQETGRSLVLVLDEFGALENFDIPDVFAQLGQRIMTQKNCLYIVSSSSPQQAQTILSEKLSLLFGNFEVISLEPFNFLEAQGLIDHNLNGVKLGLYLKNFIADFTGGHPLYINLLCQELIYLSGVYAQKEIYAPIVIAAIENVIFNPWGVISRHFELQINSLTRPKCAGTTVTLLGALAQGKHKISDLLESLKLKNSQVVSRINALQEANIVERNGNYYHIKDKLFSYWIKYVYQRRLRAIDLEAGRSRKQFKEEINRALNDFGLVARKDLSSRVADLMQKFDNESFVLCGRRYKLTSFRDIKILKLRTGTGNYFDAVSAASQEGDWLVVLKKDPVHDNDLSGILEEIKKLDPRPSRSIIVSLSGLDENAKVRALQEKLWIWDEDQLNSLMHLFDEPIIVR